MLILTRRPQETLVVGDNIKVQVLGVKGGQVRLGVEAPREVPVYRDFEATDSLLTHKDVIFIGRPETNSAKPAGSVGG